MPLRQRQEIQKLLRQRQIEKPEDTMEFELLQTQLSDMLDAMKKAGESL